MPLVLLNTPREPNHIETKILHSYLASYILPGCYNIILYYGLRFVIKRIIRIILLKIQVMKKIIGILCIGCAGVFAACNSSSTTDSVDSAQNVNDSMLPDSNSMNNDTGTHTMSSAPVSEEDAKWAVEAANGGMTEVELGKLAQQKATSDRVKNFGAMMVSDHGKAGDKLKQIAAAKSIVLPDKLSDKSQKDLDGLNKKTGNDFDKAYIKMMIDDHKKDVDKFKKGSKDLKDADLKNFASETLPVIQMHLDSINAIGGKK